MADMEIELENNSGPDSGPEYPYPIYLKGKVVKGYGRGRSELEIPTEENIPKFLYSKTGIYYGWGRVMIEGDDSVYIMVMSVGWNPYYKNQKLSAVCSLQKERNYISKKLLIEDIQNDIIIAKKSLERETYLSYKNDEFLIL
ncbi:hypothetical protein MERGE_000366 [Pneumocystis wakefieldiae]|uniref:Riboflavin kinase n=1 Tax=Pneumocystis wakefieldiae TaxID=38082 RepID=A0A899FQZ6_9ASCO|nr:hypothetical protein MERGE_000366 [Pneumocystis wakefieldiae]